MDTTHVSARALIKRINRRLAPLSQMLVVSRGEGQVYHSFGRYWINDWRRNRPVETKVDLERYARENGFIKSNETLGSP